LAASAISVSGLVFERAKKLVPYDFVPHQLDGATIQLYPYAIVEGEKQLTEERDMGKDQHVVPHNGEWAVRGAGNERVTSIHHTQAEAQAAAREIAINQQSEVVIHRPDGRIRDKDSYGHDGFPPRG